MSKLVHQLLIFEEN